MIVENFDKLSSESKLRIRMDKHCIVSIVDEDGHVVDGGCLGQFISQGGYLIFELSRGVDTELCWTKTKNQTQYLSTKEF